jgi:hypothetical protein
MMIFGQWFYQQSTLESKDRYDICAIFHNICSILRTREHVCIRCTNQSTQIAEERMDEKLPFHNSQFLVQKSQLSVPHHISRGRIHPHLSPRQTRGILLISLSFPQAHLSFRRPTRCDKGWSVVRGLTSPLVLFAQNDPVTRLLHPRREPSDAERLEMAEWRGNWGLR